MCIFVVADEVELVSPQDGEDCVVGDLVNFEYIPLEDSIVSCYLYHNNSGIWSSEKSDYNPSSDVINVFNDSIDPNHLLWGVRCMNDTTIFTSFNYSFILTDKPYCATLDSTVCPSSIRLNDIGVFKTHLANTRGFDLENQDCNVWIENNNSVVVKTFDSLIYSQQVKQQLDDEGNWINVADVKVPVTDSGGNYVFPFAVDSNWAWVGDEYTIYAVCNGVETSCAFNVTSQRLMDTTNIRDTAKKGMGQVFMVVFMGAITFFILKYVYTTYWVKS